MATKKPFEWKDTLQVGDVPQSAKKKYQVEFNSLDGVEEEEDDRWYVSITTLQFFKKKGEEEVAWHITKNATFPMDVWMQISEMVLDNLADA